ncbi:hypothetical protein FHS18_003602 [Paenibacillus phyllosphaerae]|uniref:Uncharacterized protein n=1 Tax=Paenibacillus phyllosphaerae TaxID=274593 RepID=A0A7W5AZX4_9BACL|nr:hypothetical protein [Paenibacillus phyllosphaerae]MBB3111534.1 hypothetical protein [Paenibacillus phyllosphaerae]
MNVNIELSPLADMTNDVAGYEIVTVSVGFDHRIYVLLVNQIPERIQGMFVPSRTDQTLTYKVLTIDEENIYETTINNQTYNYHFVQPLDKDKFLLAGARTRRFSDTDYERNGKIFDLDGVQLSELLLGDGIQQVQVTLSGTIWTSYFDEGVFGKYGWDHPIGASGLIAWDREGNTFFKNHQADIIDCYALNVVHDDEVWFYYYTPFHLSKISDGLTEFYNPQISGSAGFITWQDSFLFDCGYGKHDQYMLLKMNAKGSFKKVQKLKFVDREGNTLHARHRDFRGDTLVLEDRNLIYKAQLRTITAELGK